MAFRKVFQFSSLLVIMALVLLSCSSDNDQLAAPAELKPVEVISSGGITVPVYDFQGFRPMLDYYNDTLYIFNFWATWCQPCVKELPYFNMADSAYAGKAVRIVLVSLDFSENVESALIPFIIDHEVSAEVIVLDDMDADGWIPLVDPGWDGVIPATLFKMKNAGMFHVGPYTYEELEGEINNFLNP